MIKTMIKCEFWVNYSEGNPKTEGHFMHQAQCPWN